MTNYYHVWGLISSALFLLVAYGLLSQLQKIYTRKRLMMAGALLGETPCSVISVNRTFGSYAAFFGNYLLGLSLPHFDWYLVLTRSIALVLLLLTLWEIWIERRNFWSMVWLVLASLLFLLATSVASFFPNLLEMLLPVAKIWIVLALLFLLQGYLYQILLLKRHNHIGGISKFMFQAFLIKELSTLAFALTMNLSDSWPLLLQHSSLLIVEILMLTEIYRIEGAHR